MALSKVKVKDSTGKAVDISEFVKVNSGGPIMTLPEEGHDHDHDH